MNLQHAYFDGPTYVHSRDVARFSDQLRDVFHVMQDGEWHTLSHIAVLTGAPQASVSARIRDLRKERFGGYVVLRRRLADGRYEYRMVA